MGVNLANGVLMGNYWHGHWYLHEVGGMMGSAYGVIHNMGVCLCYSYIGYATSPPSRLTDPSCLYPRPHCRGQPIGIMKLRIPSAFTFLLTARELLRNRFLTINPFHSTCLLPFLFLPFST
ncbi:hypothetical protein VTJ04DRAFT_6866 [Mycothermus thermophilus]|uniref:uncharacterized protein n=1 Tax=Humicola insolens TaxID=85995 RepID=UPI003742A0FA